MSGRTLWNPSMSRLFTCGQCIYLHHNHPRRSAPYSPPRPWVGSGCSARWYPIPVFRLTRCLLHVWGAWDVIFGMDVSLHRWSSSKKVRSKKVNCYTTSSDVVKVILLCLRQVYSRGTRIGAQLHCKYIYTGMFSVFKYYPGKNLFNSTFVWFYWGKKKILNVHP